MPTSDEMKALGYVSVTEILDFWNPPELVTWKVKVGAVEARKIGRAAMKIGSRVDELIQRYIETPETPVVFAKSDTIEVRNGIRAWLQYVADHGPKIVGAQIEVLDEQNKIIGHLDIETDDAVLDVKCAGMVKASHFFQVSKYAVLRGKRDAGILRLDKSIGMYELVMASSVGIDIHACAKAVDALAYATRMYHSTKGAINEEGRLDDGSDTDPRADS